MTVVRDWLDKLYGRSPGYWAVTLFQGGRPVRTRWYSTDPADLDKAAAAITAAAPKADIYVSVGTQANPGEPGRRTRNADVVSIPGFWADLDIGEAGHKPAALPNPADEAEAMSIIADLPEPTATIHSGGGLQVWWMFDKPWTFEDPSDAARASEEFQRRLAAAGEDKGFHVDQVGDLARILRIPGTENHKLDEPRPVAIRGTNYQHAYSVAELAALGISEDRDSPDYVGPADDFPLTWAQILEPHGWHSYQPDLWWRPGKTKDEGHSAHTDPYGIPVMVNFSETSGLPSGGKQRLTKLRVFALLNYGGDVKRAKTALAELTKDDPKKLAEIAERFSGTLINWRDFWSGDRPQPEWLCEPFLQRGQQITLYSEPKAGKTLLTWDLCAGMSLGLPTLGRAEAGTGPLSILYIDKENTEDDVYLKFQDMGYKDNVLENFHYYMFPDLAFLDSREGGMELYALAQYHHADLVVVDTVSRVVEGEENSNDTFHNFYKYSGLKLKAAGTALMRLDHSGKDVSKGMRGASSKTSDVDAVWQLDCPPGSDLLTLRRTHARRKVGASEVEIERRDDPLRHVLLEAPEPGAGMAEESVEDFCYFHGIDLTGTVRSAKAAIREAGGKFKDTKIEDAVRAAKGE